MKGWNKKKERHKGKWLRQRKREKTKERKRRPHENSRKNKEFIGYSQLVKEKGRSE